MGFQESKRVSCDYIPVLCFSVENRFGHCVVQQETIARFIHFLKPDKHSIHTNYSLWDSLSCGVML